MTPAKKRTEHGVAGKGKHPAKGEGHWVTIHGAGGGYYHLFLKGPRKAGAHGRPGLKEQAAAHRATKAKGDYRERARLLAVRAQAHSRKARSAQLRALKQGKAGVAAKKGAAYHTSFRRSENLAIASGMRQPKGMIDVTPRSSVPALRR